MTTSVVARVRPGTEPGQTEILAPRVGLWRFRPEVGTLVRPGASIGAIEVLGRLFPLSAPPGAAGIVVFAKPDDRSRIPVGYGDVLLVLDPSAAGAVVDGPAADGPTRPGITGLVFAAPMSGRFYVRSGPGKPPFLTEGQSIKAGDSVCLLEVMKTFNRVTFGGPGMPEGARVKRASPDRWSERFDHAHLALKDFFKISRAEQLLLTPGCTSSLSVGIADVDMGKNNRILTSSWEHHALHRPLLKWSLQGIDFEVVAPSDSGPMDLNRLEHALREGGVGMVAITAACNVTGDLLPFMEVIDLAHRYDAQVALDAAQVVGWLPLNFQELGADLIAFGGHKGLQGPWGIGGLYVADTARMSCCSASCQIPVGGEVRRPGYCDAGSVDQFALAGLHAAILELQNLDLTTELSTARVADQEVRASFGGLSGCPFIWSRVRTASPDTRVRG